MIFLFALLPLVLGKTSIPGQLRLISSPIDQLTEQPLIDRVWQDCLITAPATINLLGHVMIAASSTDVSFLHYSPNRTYRYIKYPDSLRTTLLQISNGKKTPMNFVLFSNFSSSRLWILMYSHKFNVKTHPIE